MKPKPWWELGSRDASEAQGRLKSFVSALGCRHLVAGHQANYVAFADGTTRKAGEICEKFNGLLYFIDVGMSRGTDGSLGALLYVPSRGGRPMALLAGGRTREVSAALCMI